MFHALLYLRQDNALYSDIEIILDNIPSDLLSLSAENGNNKTLERSDCLEEDQSSLHLHRFNSQETVMISNSPTLEELSIAPNQAKQQRSILNDNFCEELAFPYLFPKCGYKVERKIKLSPVKYFNQRLLNFTQMFASDPDYVFFALSVTQQMKLQSQINIALKKVCTCRITSGMLSHNFSDTVKSFIANDEAYHFINTIKGTPYYWKRFIYEVLAMMKQLGISTFYDTV